MKPIMKAGWALGLVLAAACSDNPGAPSDGALDAVVTPGHGHQITVMSRNMYIGTDLDAVIAALANTDPADDFPAMVNAAGVLQETDYDLRVEAIVGEIARTRPAVIGLQEVTRIDIDLSAYGAPIVINGDFMTDLTNEIAARSLPYVVGSQVQNWVASPFPGINLVDFDVLLVDPSRVTIGAVSSHTFSNNLGPIFPGINQVRGWTGIEATYENQPFVFVVTHLESGAALGELREQQAQQLMSVLAHRPRVILMGDFNDQAGSHMYRRIREAGFRDAWASLRADAGYTCCMAPDLANERPRFDQRIDFIFTKGMDFPEEGLIGDIRLTGIDRLDRLDGPSHTIWPSDHAGLVARLRIPFLNVDAE
jgi:endonuclease/exonuclease/phosphatase family metal-dependent hydrolase